MTIPRVEKQQEDLTPAEKRLRAQGAVRQSWANTEDPRKRTAPARAALFARFERQVDPDGILGPLSASAGPRLRWTHTWPGCRSRRPRPGEPRRRPVRQWRRE